MTDPMPAGSTLQSITDAGHPDVHYGDDDHFVAGDRGVSEWTPTGTTTDGLRLEVRGCDLRTFRDGLVVKKDSYWKIVEAPVEP